MSDSNQRRPTEGVAKARKEAREAGPVNAAARAAERLELAGENRRAAGDPGYRLVSTGLKETARDYISAVRSNRLARVAQAKTEAAYAKHDLKEAKQALDAGVAREKTVGLTVGALRKAGEYRRASADPQFAELSKVFKDHVRAEKADWRTRYKETGILKARSEPDARNTGEKAMDQSTARAEVAHAKHDLKEARQEDIWQQAIEIGRQVQIAGEQTKQEKTETASPRMAP